MKEEIISTGNIGELIRKLKKKLSKQAKVKSLIFENKNGVVRTIGQVYKSGRKRFYKPLK